jgi:hypothetical protein
MAAANLGSSRMLRNYNSVHVSPNLTIVEAIRIAWATPGLFSSVRVGPKLMPEVLISAVSIANNPTLQAIEEAHEVFGKGQRVCCVLSLGTGQPATGSLSMDNLDINKFIARDTETTAEKLKKRYSRLQIYFRLSMDPHVDFGTAPDASQLRAGNINAFTSSYLQTHDASEVLDGCLRSSRQVSHVTLESLCW